MSFINKIMQPKAALTSADLFKQLKFGTAGSSGKAVNIDTALNVVSVFACLRVIAEGVAQVPFKVFKERTDGGRDAAKEHSLFDLLHRQPNLWQTSFEFRETLVFHAGLAGNFYAFKSMGGGRVLELIPLEPGTVNVKRNKNTELTYDITANGETKTFPAELIWHVRGPSWDSWQGMAAVKQAREAIGLSIATEESHGLFHKNGAQTSGTYSVDGPLTEQQHEALNRWIAEHVSNENKFKPLVLDRGAKFTPTSMSGVDSQHLETRKHQVEEVCRAFRVMPIMVGQADKAATYASSEQMFLAHVVHTLMPWYERIEQSADVNLLTTDERKQGFYVKFLPNGLMRGSAKDRSEFYFKMWQMGVYNPNKILSLEDENPYTDGDKYYVPANFAPVDDQGKTIK